MGLFEFVKDTINDNDFVKGMIVSTLVNHGTNILTSIPSNIISTGKKHLTTSVSINSADNIYYLLVKTLMTDEIISKSRSFKFLSDDRYLGDGVINRNTYKTLGNGRHLCKYKGQYLLFNISEEPSRGGGSNKPITTITITKFGRSHKLFDDLFDELKKQRENDTKDMLTLVDYQGYHICTEPKRRKDSVILSEENELKLYDSLDKFNESEDWYIETGVPYHLGILLYGVPGTGKTSLIKQIATYLDRKIMIVNSPTELEEASTNGKDYLIVIEEVDTFGASKREFCEDDDENCEDDPFSKMSASIGSHTLGKMLQSLDGLVQPHGRIIVMTTNDKDSLDDALIRCGRVDLQLNIDYADNHVFKGLCKKFYKDDYSDDKFDGFEIKSKCAPASIQGSILNGCTLDELIEHYRKE